MPTADDIIKKIHKDHGETAAVTGGKDYEEDERIPTGIFAIDVAMGGGWPRGRFCIVYGNESSNKTNLALQTIAEAQILFPKERPVFIDVERSLNLPWARKMRVDTNRLTVLTPETAEQAVDFIESFIYATDVSIIVIDSLAALTTNKEIENAAEVQAVGGASLIIGKLCRKITSAFTKMRNSGHVPPTVLAINQVRSKIGGYGPNPISQPGGNPPKFTANMIMRVYGKNVMDSKISAVLPAYKQVTATIEKWKCPILQVNAEYTMQMVKGGGNNPGYVKDWNTLMAFMKELDYLAKADKGGWAFNGSTYKTLDDIKEVIYSDPELLQSMKQTVIAELVNRGDLGESTGEIDVD